MAIFSWDLIPIIPLSSATTDIEYLNINFQDAIKLIYNSGVARCGYAPKSQRTPLLPVRAICTTLPNVGVFACGGFRTHDSPSVTVYHFPIRMVAGSGCWGGRPIAGSIRMVLANVYYGMGYL